MSIFNFAISCLEFVVHSCGAIAQIAEQGLNLIIKGKLANKHSKPANVVYERSNDKVSSALDALTKVHYKKQ